MADKLKMIVFYFLQLMTIAFELNYKSYGLELNYINSKPTLKEKTYCRSFL
jgi:heterodisulfide reductase subunit B